MFRFKLDFSEANGLTYSLERAAAIYPKSVISGALRESTGPMLRAAREEAPVSGGGRERVAVRYGKSGRGSANDYRRGGATRRDLRIRIADTRDGNPVALIGVSKKSGKVGWRAHFITRGVRKAGKGRNINIAPNDFLKRAFDRTFNGVVNAVVTILGRRAQAYLSNTKYRRSSV
ncbi:hypothetical protein GCM10027299_21530 [Larkinella ripae]